MKQAKISSFILFYMLWMLFLGCIILPAKATPQADSTDSLVSEKGLPFITNFHPRQYKHLTTFPDTWAIAEDAQGAMVIGNSGGILRYNGTFWQFIETPAKSIVRALAKDANGRIYVGASDDLGYLATNQIGRQQFISLLSYLPASQRTFGDIQKVYATPQGVYFQTRKYLFRWHKDQFQSWETATSFTRAFYENKTLYIQQLQKGLFAVKNNELSLISQDTFFTNTPLQLLLPLRDGSFLAGTRLQGLFRFNGSQITPVFPEASLFGQQHRLYHGIVLPTNDIAIATLTGGVIIISQQGEIRQVLNKTSGLTSNATYGLATDQYGDLWVAMDKGISHVELNSPFSYFDERSGLEGSIQAMQWHQGKLYIGTHTGLYVRDKTGAFRKVTPDINIIYTLHSTGESLLIGGNEGIYELKNNMVSQVSKTPCVDIQPSRFNPDVFFIASDGLFVLRKVASGWKEDGIIPGIRESMHAVIETPTGDLWLPTRWQGTIHVQFQDTSATQFLQHMLIKKYGIAQGLPSGNNHIYFIDGRVLLQIGDESGNLFELTANNTFKLVTNFNKQFGLPDKVIYPGMVFSRSDSVWLWTRNKNENNRYWTLATLQPDGTYHTRPNYFNQLSDYLERLTHLEKNGIMWFGGSEKLVRFAWKTDLQDARPFATLLERIQISADSVVYPVNMAQNISLPFKYNSLRFQFAAPYYKGEENKFQYILEGFDEQWSEWTNESFKEYTWIQEGNYTFRVRSLNSFGQVGKEATYTFRILPPWYRTWAMFILYGLLAGGFILMLIRWRSAALQAEKVELERIVTERTTEVATKNQQLAVQAEELAAQTDKLTKLDQAKSRFFANISHEFRTPLTLILNSLVDKLADIRKQPKQTQINVTQPELNVMYRNSKRLLELINQLLDLSKIESGKMTLNLQNGDLTQLLQIIVASFSSLAIVRNIDFQLIKPEKPILCRFDADKVEKILYNLLSNAFKFTPEGGKIILTLETIQESSGQPTWQKIQFSLQDSGPGISPEQLQLIFDRFYQGKQYYADEQGTGIGLALTKELVELHQGSIWVDSKLGKGTCFTVQLPLLPITDGVLAVPSAVSLDISGVFIPDIAEQAAMRENSVTDPISEEMEEFPLVLIVEDNTDLRQYIRAQLSGKYRIIESENGTKGLEQALETIPDLIVSDLMMPGLDGLELCHIIKTDERTSHIPVIILTALATSEARIAGLETGADDYLTKPFDNRELDIRIHNLISGRRKLRDSFMSEISRHSAHPEIAPTTDTWIQPAKVVMVSADEKFLQRAILVVEQNMADVTFSVEEFSREIGMSRMQLHRKLKALTGQSASDFIRIMRLKRAAQLLEAKVGNVTEVAYQVGFNTLSYFSKCFHDYFGVMPTEYASGNSIDQI
ncbi:response regulator [Rhodocytophaga rosea]|uniref:histidine kinase n=1 Tax=Rhodocytophaga rosea TaxID=2704465 RepID=A0A6C0GKC4_9BACT|nr:ATP-binding protein [Rhodocytophaga rosea]QHT68486.1 response regulator [Rhodocytophaga rosea]